MRLGQLSRHFYFRCGEALGSLSWDQGVRLITGITGIHDSSSPRYTLRILPIW